MPVLSDQQNIIVIIHRRNRYSGFVFYNFPKNFLAGFERDCVEPNIQNLAFIFSFRANCEIYIDTLKLIRNQVLQVVVETCMLDPTSCSGPYRRNPVGELEETLLCMDFC